MDPRPMPQVDFRHVGPQIGEPFPQIILPDQHGATVDLHAARQGRKAMVIFYRSASW